jgi:hypothetical protein
MSAATKRMVRFKGELIDLDTYQAPIPDPGTQSTPDWPIGYIPTAVEWSAWWSIKADAGAGSAGFLALSGGTMTGPLILSGDATDPLGAVTKRYVDSFTPASGPFLPMAGGTVTGPLNINQLLTVTWPTSVFKALAGQAVQLRVDATSAHSRQLFGANNGSSRWSLTMGDASAESGSNAGANFSLDRYNDTGVLIDSPITVNRATGTVNFAHPITVSGALLTSTFLPLTGGVVTGLTTFNNGLAIGGGWSFAIDGSGNRDQVYSAGWYDQWIAANGTRQWVGPGGLMMALDGAANLNVLGSFTANGTIRSQSVGRILSMRGDGNQPSVVAYNTNVATAVGFWADSNQLSFGAADGNGVPLTDWMWLTSTALNVVGSVSAASFGASGAISGNALNIGAGTVSCGSVVAGNGLFQIAPNYYLQRGGDGNWRFVENGTVNGTVTPDGSYFARTNVSAGNAVYGYNGVYCGSSSDFGMFPGGDGRVMQFAANWYWDWNSSNGDMIWRSPSGDLWHMRASDKLTWNPSYSVGGNGPYLNVSDASVKANVTKTGYGLAEILKLKPVGFQRYEQGLDKLASPRLLAPEVGFVADDVLGVLPEAVVAITSENHRSLFALRESVILAVAVSAIKELAAELAALKARLA